MKASEEFKQEARAILIGLVVLAGLLLLMIGAAVAKEEIGGALAITGILGFVLVVLAISYWGDKKTHREIEQEEAQKERKRQQQPVS